MQNFFKFLLTIFLSFLFTGSSFGEKNIIPIFKQSKISTNYQFKNYRQNYLDSIPHQIGYTNDFENIFTIPQIITLDKMLADFKKEMSIQIVLITLDSTMTSKEDFDDFVLDIQNAWGIGAEFNENGIVIAISKGFRRIRISNGIGIQKILSDNETKQLVEHEFIPYFKKSEYYIGTANGLKSLLSVLKNKMK